MTAWTRVLLSTSFACWAAGCADSGSERITPTYDPDTGRLRALTYDRNDNGTVDTWADFDGSTPVSARTDLDEDGAIDRWEYYDERGNLTKVGVSRQHDGRVDAWVFSDSQGVIERIELSSSRTEGKVDRWEHYESGVLARAQEDTNGDGLPDKTELYENGVLKTASLDEDGDGRPDRRLTYSADGLISIESEPDATGAFRKSVRVK